MARASTNFYTNLARLASQLEGSTLIQRNVFLTKKRRVVAAARRLAEHYGASTEVFRGHEAEL